MGTTPNYKWPVPDNTRAFRNGALDMTALGNAIDASTKALDTAYKAADSSIRSDFGAADASITSAYKAADTAIKAITDHGGGLTRAAQQATASTSVDVALPMDGIRDMRGSAYGGSSLGLVEAGLYVIQATMEVGVGAGGELQIIVRTGGGTQLCAAGGQRNGGVRTILSCGAVWALGANVSLTLRYTTTASMTITGAALMAYRIGTG